MPTPQLSVRLDEESTALLDFITARSGQPDRATVMRGMLLDGIRRALIDLAGTVEGKATVARMQTSITQDAAPEPAPAVHGPDYRGTARSHHCG